MNTPTHTPTRWQRLRRWFSARPRGQKIVLLAVGLPLTLLLGLIIAAYILFFFICLQWNGKELRQQEHLIYTGLDYRHPVDGTLYRVRNEKGGWDYYARLPEIRYRILPRLIEFDMYGGKGWHLSDIEPTGRVGIGELEVCEKLRTPDPVYGGYTSTDSPTPTELEACVREVDALPEGAEPLPAPTRSRPHGLLEALWRQQDATRRILPADR